MPGRNNDSVMPGLDPGIHLLFVKSVDCRVQPGNDAE